MARATGKFDGGVFPAGGEVDVVVGSVSLLVMVGTASIVTVGVQW